MAEVPSRTPTQTNVSPISIFFSSPCTCTASWRPHRRTCRPARSAERGNSPLRRSWERWREQQRRRPPGRRVLRRPRPRTTGSRTSPAGWAAQASGASPTLASRSAPAGGTGPGAARSRWSTCSWRRGSSVSTAAPGAGSGGGCAAVAVAAAAAAAGVEPVDPRSRLNLDLY